MFAIYWTKRCLEYLTSTEHPTTEELDHAYLNAYKVVSTLEDKWKKKLERFSCYPYQVRLIDEVLQALRDDHGGVLPFEVFSAWGKNRREQERLLGNGPELFATPDEERAMISIWERWTDDSIKQQFWALRIGDYDDNLLCFHSPWFLPEYRVLEVGRCLEDWLQKRKAG